MGCRLYQRKYCGKQLEWYIIQDECNPSQAPDVVFKSDPTFSPLLDQLDTVHHQQLVQLLEAWDSLNGSSTLDGLVGLLLQLYAEHNRARIAAVVTDERILFELSMLDELGCTEVLLAGNEPSGPLQVCFTLPVPADLSPAKQLIAYTQQQQHVQDNAVTQHVQPPLNDLHLEGHEQHKQQQEQLFLLNVAFTAASTGSSSSSSSSHIPELQLLTPSWFSSQLPAVTLPAWDPHTSLVEYVPHLAEKIERHLAENCPVAVQRFQFFELLSDILGPPLEANMNLSSSTSLGSDRPRSSAGSLAAAGGGAAGAVGGGGSKLSVTAASGAAAALYQVFFEQQPMLLFVELPRSYPADSPNLSLHNLRRVGLDSSSRLINLPWSPRWPVDEQVARLFNSLKQQAAKATLADTALQQLSGTAAASPPPPATAAGTSPGPSSPVPPGFYL